MSYEQLIAKQKQNFIDLADQQFKTLYPNATKRAEVGLEDLLLDRTIDHIVDEIEDKAHPIQKNNYVDVSDLLWDTLTDYSDNKKIDYKLDTPIGKTIHVKSLEDCFEFIYLYDIKNNLHRAVEDYLAFADMVYEAVIFDSPVFKFNIADFWSDEEMTKICEEITNEILHKQNDLTSCQLFWDNEKVILFDNNYVDDYEKERLYDALLQWGKDHGFNSLEELDWWFE